MERERPKDLIGRLAVEHGHWVIRRLICKGVPEDVAQDGLQEGLTGALEYLTKDGAVPPQKQAEKSWLLTIAWRAIVNGFRKNTREDRARRGYADHLRAGDPAVLDHEATRIELEEAWERALTALPVEDRTIVTLRYCEDWMQRDIAEQLDLTRAAVAGRLCRALHRLSRVLDEWGSDEVA